MVLNIPAQVTVDTLVKVVAQLPSDTLDDFLAQVNLIRQHQMKEATLLAAIQRRLPVEQQRRLGELRDALENETLTEAERIELLELVEQAEAADVERAEALLALAQKRGISVRQLMDDLNLELGRAFSVERRCHSIDRSYSYTKAPNELV
jgi:AraC-like DNA-binding protein